MVNTYFFHTYFWKKIDLGGYAAFFDIDGLAHILLILWYGLKGENSNPVC